MDGIDQLHILIEVVVAEIFFEEDAHEPCMPVVAVDDIGLKADGGQHGQNGTAEIGKPFGVIAVAVEIVPLEIPFVVDKIDGHPVLFYRFDAVIELAPRQVDRTGHDGLHLFFDSIGNTAVFRNDQPDVHAFLG